MTEAKKVLLKDLVEQARKEYGWSTYALTQRKTTSGKSPTPIGKNNTIKANN